MLVTAGMLFPGSGSGRKEKEEGMGYGCCRLQWADFDHRRGEYKTYAACCPMCSHISCPRPRTTPEGLDEGAHDSSRHMRAVQPGKLAVKGFFP